MRLLCFWQKMLPIEHISSQGFPTDPTGPHKEEAIPDLLSPSSSSLVQKYPLSIPPYPRIFAKAGCPKPPKVPQMPWGSLPCFCSRGWAKGQTLHFKVNCSQARQGHGAEERLGWQLVDGWEGNKGFS